MKLIFRVHEIYVVGNRKDVTLEMELTILEDKKNILLLLLVSN